MRVVIDSRWIFRELSGIGLYTRELIRHLPEIDTENEYHLIFDDIEVMEREKAETGFDTAANFSVAFTDSGVFSARSQLALPGMLKRLRADVFHSPNYMIPFRAFPRNQLGGTGCVITVHDLIPLLFPHYTPRAIKTRFFPVFKRVMRETAARADVVIAPSNSTRRDIAEYLYSGKEDAGRIEVIYQGVSSDYIPASISDGREPVILYVGRHDPYKNVSKLIEAYARLRSRGVLAGLRIVGSDDERYPEARETAHRFNVDEFIQWDGYLDGAGLIDAYQQADVFVLPSRYEGFGLTVLESMACGTPVVCGNRSSLPEVVGDAALTVNPDSVEQIEAAIASLLGDPDLAARMRVVGLKRAMKFTWRRTSEATADVYRAVAENIERTK